jgi:hypothetical protein
MIEASPNGSWAILLASKTNGSCVRAGTVDLELTAFMSPFTSASLDWDCHPVGYSWLIEGIQSLLLTFQKEDGGSRRGWRHLERRLLPDTPSPSSSCHQSELSHDHP